MNNILKTVGISAMFIGIILVIISFLTFSRNKEHEISTEFYRKPIFIIGVVMSVIGIALQIINAIV